MKINFLTYNKFLNINKANNTSKIRRADNPFASLQNDVVEISFKGNDHCATSNFQIKNIPNLHCPACGLVMLTDAQIANFIELVSNKKGENLVSALEYYENESNITGKPSRDKKGFGIYRPIKKQIVDIYKDLAFENPNMDLVALTQLQAQRCIDALIDKQMEVIEELKAYANENLEGKELDSFLDRIEKFVKQINGEGKDAFARKKFIYAMKSAITGPHKANIEQIASKMPTSENDINSFFVKYAKKNSTCRDIASKFVNQSIPTAEHIKPRALGGGDSLSNYICDCADCNSKRGHTPFYVWLQETEGLEERLQTYINDIRVVIDEDKLPANYDTYTEKVIETFKKVTDGKIILENPEIQNPEKRAVVIKQRKNEINKLKTQNEALRNRKENLEQEVEELSKYAKIYEIETSLGALEAIQNFNTQIDELMAQIETLKRPMYKLKEELATQQERIDNESVPTIKSMLQTKYDAKNEEYLAMEEQNNFLVQEVYRIKSQIEKIKASGLLFFEKEIDLKEKIKSLRELLSKIDDINKKSAKYDLHVEKEAEMREKFNAVRKELYALRMQKKAILESGFDPENTELWNKYNHQKAVLKVMEKILDNKEYKKTSSNTALAREGIEIGVNTIKKTIEEMEATQEIQNFILFSKLKATEAQNAQLSDRIGESLVIKRELRVSKEEKELLKNTNEEALKDEYAKLLFEKKMVENLYKINSKKDEILTLNRILKKNDYYLKQLEKYETLTNGHYSKYVSFVEVENV